MTPQLRDEILGLEGPLLTYAAQVCADAEEARDLVQLTLRTALEARRVRERAATPGFGYLA